MHTYMTELYIMSIQPVNKAAEHINSTPVLERKKEEEEKRKAVNAYLIKNSKGKGEGGVGALSQAVGKIGRSIMSQSILLQGVHEVYA